jgi:threonine synthase
VTAVQRGGPVVASSTATALSCAGCGFAVPAGDLVLRCPRALPGDDVDHVIRRTLDPSAVSWPAGGEPNPFIRYRTLWHGYHLARAAGRGDAEVVAEIALLDEAIARVAGHGFAVTPFEPAKRLGGVLVKNETGNVSGSHKARHLLGTLLALRLSGTDDPSRPLAIASCGNAALAAAVVARAAGRRLLVFVPPEANRSVLRRLTELEAEVETCARRAGEAGDPTVLRMREAIAEGAIAFTCQGNENGLAVEGGLTLGYELVDALRATGGRLDHLLVQVGGGALASSVMQAFAEAHAMGAIEALPRIYAVQTRNAHPLARAYDRVVAHLGAVRPMSESERRWIAGHRSNFMWPWTPAPQSIASGILDDETYDWLAVVAGLLATGGRPLTVGESDLREANELARRRTHVEVDVTGSAGLAGLTRLRHIGEALPNETSAVLFTGIRRH